MTERELLLAEIRRIDQILAEREKQVNLALDASQHAIDKAEAEGLRARNAANEWRGAMTEREERFATKEAHDLLESQVDYLRRATDTSKGRSAAWVAAAGIIATLLAIGVGQILRQGVTSSDISAQIAREAPWNRDKAPTERRIRELEVKIQALEVKVNKLESDLRAHMAIDGR
jgi:hypothetical protein